MGLLFLVVFFSTFCYCHLVLLFLLLFTSFTFISSWFHEA
jgi:hypothetical protein